MSKQSRPWNRRQRRAIRNRTALRPWSNPKLWSRRPRTYAGGRGIAHAIAEDLVMQGAEPVNPHLFGPGYPTSTRRRWAQLTRVKMRRERPHPRPWEGPRVSFNGIFRSVGVPVATATATASEMLAEIAHALTQEIGAKWANIAVYGRKEGPR